MFTTRIASVRAAKNTDANPLTPLQIKQAYNYPADVTGKGVTIGIVELAGAFTRTDLEKFLANVKVTMTGSVTTINVAGGEQKSDGPDGLDGEVALDVELAAAFAPGADLRVYFAPNTDPGFLAAVVQAAKECDIVSVSYGQAETKWARDSLDKMAAAFAEARGRLVNVHVAAGDSGSRDGTRKNVVDFPASCPDVVAWGGTQLTVNPDGSRATEVVWDIDDRTHATGGGKSVIFPGRDVPDVAANASAATGYTIVVDGQEFVVGGTSACAPIGAALNALLMEATGGSRFDFQKLVIANPETCFDVTSGDNGGFRAGPGRDETTGFGVPDGQRLLEALVASTRRRTDVTAALAALDTLTKDVDEVRARVEALQD